MASYRLTRHARRDLLEIWQRIAEAVGAEVSVSRRIPLRFLTW